MMTDMIVRKKSGKRLVASILLAAAFFVQGIITAMGAEKPETLVSATYCSDAWVINFWNSESDALEAELAQIKADGFNSIILAVPWREFQPSVKQPGSYNAYAWEKLHRVMAAAAKQELWVVLRVGYTWDYYAGDNVLARYEALLYEQGSSRGAWLQYAKKLHQEASEYDNFYGGFLTWEDFWNFTDKAGGMGSSRESVSLARKIGYQDYLELNYSLEDINQMYGKEFQSFASVSLPQRSEHAYVLFYSFYDDFLRNLLADTQAVFPNLSMEVRLDVDPVRAADGNSDMGVPHYSTFGCEDSSFTSAMYAVSMGHETGKVLTAEEALETMAHELAVMQIYNGGKPIYLDQFLYMDTTEEFAHNSQLKPEERAAFLRQAAPALGSMTMGYGIWTYRNYTDNAIYNPQFALGEQGWKFESGSQVELRGSSMAARLSGRASITQDVTARLGSRKNGIKLRFTADSDKPVDITVSIGGVSKTLAVDGPKQVELNFGKVAGQIRFQASGEAWIDNVNVYSYEQDGQLYGLDGEELSCLEALRELNTEMFQ